MNRQSLRLSSTAAFPERPATNSSNPRGAEGVLHVHGQEADAKLIRMGWRDVVLFGPCLGLRGPALVVHLPDLSHPLRIEVSGNGNLLAAHVDPSRPLEIGRLTDCPDQEPLLLTRREARLSAGFPSFPAVGR